MDLEVVNKLLQENTDEILLEQGHNRRCPAGTVVVTAL